MSDQVGKDTSEPRHRIPARAALEISIDENPIDQILVREPLVDVCRDGAGGYRVTLGAGKVVPLVPQANGTSDYG